ncbi:dTDP-4-dehydrorhamnose reductase [Stygiobacter electus]|uniref:dTDP-4-dehydrorhamnose reductase n=1 Tax=Stygiobacter electus TaxID=3032292 RepID=A0AAE3P1H4_9BACT|nr:dTDP-4-dehydrorhamnose reductase [Stygiobacter electus]MDF1612657.1 dTDP-4-dehydrorhamnose reductase [Stygiobacter electus]
MIKKRILIIGSNGMLGQRLTEYFSKQKDVELLCTSAETKSFIPDIEYQQLDITQKNEVKNIITKFFPDFIINAAAYTNVDKAETERELCWKINVNGVDNIAFYSWTIDSHLIHISSDYIFDGKNGPYTEIDLPNPISYYGRTKLASENSIKASGTRFTIIRSNVLYGPSKYGRPDFVKWVYNSLKNSQKIKIVTDQINNPTYIDDLVNGISNVIKNKKEGIYNIGGKELLSRFEFTKIIAKMFNLNTELIIPILTEELNQPAKRPLKSGLINLKAETELNYKPKSIIETLELMKKELELD